MTRTLGQFVAVTVLVLGLVGGTIALVAGDHDTRALPSEFSERFNAQTLRDVVSLADAVAVVTLVDDREIGLSREEKRRGEGSSGRELTLEVEQVIWRRKGASSSPPRQFKTLGLGYIYSDGKRHVPGSEGSFDFETGERYLVALLDYSREPDAGPTERWGALSQRVIIQLDGNEPVKRGPFPPELAEHNLSELATLLSTTEPYPSARSHPKLSATKRSELAFERGEIGTTTTD